jgi:hypothetical protein
MATVDDATRARVALGWEESGLSQAEYAASRGISERTLRQWRSRFATAGMPVEEARRTIEEAIQKLQALLAGLEASARDDMDGPACRSAVQDESVDETATPPNMPAEASRSAPEPHRELPAAAKPANGHAPPPDADRQSATATVPPTAAEQRRARRAAFYRDMLAAPD